MNNCKNIDEWEVLTPSGWSDFSAIKKVEKNCYLSIVLSNDTVFLCSKEHKIKLKTGKFIFAVDLLAGDELDNDINVSSIEKIYSDVDLYDLINVEKNNEYYTDSIVSHNCAHIPGFEELWTGLWPTLSCLSGDTRVITNKGIKKIEDFCKGKNVGEYFKIDGLETVGLNGKLENVSHGYVSPEGDTYKIKTRKGLEVEVTHNHPLFKLCSCGGSMVQAKKLKVGDFLRVDVGMDVWGDQSVFNNGQKSSGHYLPTEINFAYMLGGFIAEGWITNNNTLIEISNQDDEFRNVYLNNKIVKEFVSKNNDECRLRCSSVELVNLFVKAGINPEWKCDTKRVPEGIWSAPKIVVSEFLKAYFDGDGSVTSSGIIGSSTSEKLLQDIQQLLLNFGIVSNVLKNSIDKQKQYGRLMPSGQVLSSLKDSYTLSVPRSFFKKFSEEIGFKIERKQNRLLQLANIYKSDTRKQFKIPLVEIRETVIRVLANTTKTKKWFRENGLRIDKVNNGIELNNAWFKRLLDIVQENDIPVGFENKEFLQEMTISCFWDEIVSITPSKNKTYDFTVPGTHAFLQNGIVGSNTGGSAILLSTPNGTSNFFHKEYIQARDGITSFNCRFGTYTNPHNPDEIVSDRFPWWVNPDCDMTWFAAQTAGKNPRDIAQEFLCSFNASGDTFIDHETLNYLENVTYNPGECFPSNREVWIWERPRTNGFYLISVDVSRGDATDYSAFHVVRLDSNPLVQVAEYKGKTRPDQLGCLLYEVGSHYNNAIIAPENNSGWSGPTINKLKELGYTNIYYSRRRNIGYKKSIYSVDPYDAQRRYDYLPGYSITANNRLEMLAKMEQYVRLRDIIIHSPRLLDEFKTFIVNLNNKPEAQRGSNDDLVMSLAGGLWVRDEAFLYSYRTDENAQSLISGISVSSNTTKNFRDFNFSNNNFYDRGRVQEHLAQQNKVVLANGDVEDISWLLPISK